jgi:hypothetical protein
MALRTDGTGDCLPSLGITVKRRCERCIYVVRYQDRPVSLHVVREHGIGGEAASAKA